VVYDFGTLDTRTKNNSSIAMAIGDETTVTLDVHFESGSHNNSRCELQHSPDGVTWFSSTESTNGTGTITAVMATSMVRVCVLIGEGSAAQASYFITAK
jgi:hypothetical protein